MKVERSMRRDLRQLLEEEKIDLEYYRNINEIVKLKCSIK